MWLKNIYSKSEGGEKNMGGQEDAIDYDEEEQHRRGGAAADAAEDYAGAAANGRDANGEESAHKREDASDEGECPMDDAQINEQIENIIKNMSSDEEEEGEVVEDEIPYDRIEASNELNKEVILLNFYSDMSNQRLTSLMSVFGKVRNSFIDDNEGVHVIFNSVKSSKRAKEFLDNLKIKNRRIQVIYGTYQERRNDPCMVGASVPGEDITDGVVGEGGIGDDVHGTGQMEGTPNDISTSSHHEKLRTHKNGRTPVKLYKNRKYYLNTVPTNAQNSVAANFTYNSHAKGMVPHVKTNAYFVAPSSSSYRLNGFVSASEMSFSQQEKAPTDNHLHSSTRGGNPNKHHHSQALHHNEARHHNETRHPDQAAHHDMASFSSGANYVHPPPPPPPSSLTPYSQSFSESGRGNKVEPYPHYSHPNNPPGGQPGGQAGVQPGSHTTGHPTSHPSGHHLGSEGTVNRMPNNQLPPPHVKRKKMTENFHNTFISNAYKKNSFNSPPGNPPFVSYSNQPPTSSRTLHMKGVPPPPHFIGKNSTHSETNMTNPIGGNHPPLLMTPRSRDLPTSSTVPPYNNTFYRPHASNNQHHGGKTSYGNLASSEDYPTPHALYSNYEEYTPHGAHGAHAGHAGHVSHSAHTVKPPKLAKYSKTVKHSRNQNPLLASEREANQIDESVEYIPFNEDNPFGISEENKMLDNPTWNDRKIKQVLQWDQGASIEKNHLDFVDSFGSTKIFNRYLLVTDFPDHLDDENKVKEYMNELFSSEKLHRICVEVSLFVPIEVDEERFFKNATKAEEEEGAVNQGEDDTVNQGEEGAVNQGEEGVVNQGEEGVVNQGEEGAVNQGEQDAPIQGEEAKPEDAPKGAKRRGAKKAAAPKQRKKRGKAKEEEEEQQQQQAAQVGEAHEAGAADQADQTEQADQAGQAGAAEQGNNPPADAARGKRYAHLTFRTIKNCVQAKKALEKNQIKVTFSVPNKANVCLWIGNVLKNFFINTANILKSMFMHFGGLKNIKYVQDKNCIFLQYFTVTDAIKARNHMYGLQVSNNTMLNIDYSTLGEWEGKQHKVSVTRKRLLDALAYDNGKMKEKLESTLRMRNPGFIDPKVMLLLKNGDSHGSNTAGGGAAGGAAGGGVRIKRHATDKSDEHNLKRRPTWDENYLPSTSMHRRKHRSSVIDSYPTSNSANDRTRERGGHSRHDKRESKRSSKRKGATTSDYSPHHHHSNHNNSHSNHNNSHSNHNNSHSNHNNNHNNHHNHRHHDHHHRRHKKRRSGNSGSGDGGDAAGYISRGEEGDSTSEITKSATNRDHAEEEIDSDFNSLDGVELNDYNEIQKTVSFYVNQKYKCDFISNFYDGNPELKIYPKLNVETKSDVHNLMNIRNSCIDYSVWQLGPTVTQKKKFLHICEHFSKKKNIPVIIDKNFTIFIVPMKEDYLKDLGIDNPDFMYAFVLQTKKN